VGRWRLAECRERLKKSAESQSASGSVSEGSYESANGNEMLAQIVEMSLGLARRFEDAHWSRLVLFLVDDCSP